MSPRNKQPQHIYDVLRPLLTFSKWLGLTTFRIVGEPPYVQIKVTLADFAALLVNFATNCFCVYLNISNIKLSRVTGSVVMDTGLAFLFPFGATMMIVLAIDNFLRRNSTCAIIAEFFQVDRSLQRKNHHVHHGRQYRLLQRILITLLVILAIGTTFSLSMALVSNFSLRSHAITAFSYAITGLQFMIINFHFVCAAWLVSLRLAEIERCLRNHLAKGSWWIERKNRWGRTVEPIDVVADLSGDFAALEHIVAQVNRIYSNQIIALITGVGMFSIFVLYASSYSYYIGRTEGFHMSLSLLVAWVYYIIMIGLIFRSGAMVSNAGRDIVRLLNEAIQTVDDLVVQRKLIYFSQQILLQQPKVKSIFYDFNWKTMFSMFGFIVTYLIILMQFDEPSDGSSANSFS